MTTAIENPTMQPNDFTAVSKRREPVAVRVTPPKISRIKFRLRGTAPYVQLRFSQKAINVMREKMAAGSQARKVKSRSARNFQDDYQQAFHVSEEGWYGIPASAFRNAIISACRLVQFKMTLAKLSVFVEPDGFDRDEGIPLVRIHGTPEPHEATVRNATGVIDIRVRAMWREWSADVVVSYDEDQFSATDVTNLMARVGCQVGIGEGRHDSKDSAGMGWGLFRID